MIMINRAISRYTAVHMASMSKRYAHNQTSKNIIVDMMRFDRLLCRRENYHEAYWQRREKRLFMYNKRRRDGAIAHRARASLLRRDADVMWWYESGRYK